MKLLQHVDTDVTKTKFTLLILTGLPLAAKKYHIQSTTTCCSRLSAGGTATSLPSIESGVAQKNNYYEHK
jgi:hypothetical protein